MMRGTQIRPGNVIKVDGVLYVVMDVDHVTPGKGRAHIQTRLRNLETGGSVPMRFRPNDGIEDVFTETRPVQYLYDDGQNAVFMDQQTYEQFNIPHDQIAGQLQYMPPDAEVQVRYADGKAISVDLPTTVALQVTEAPPVVRGDTVSNVQKTVTVETGLQVKCPPYVESGERIEVDTRTGEFVRRAN